jgi:hypothetical protein
MKRPVVPTFAVQGAIDSTARVPSGLGTTSPIVCEPGTVNNTAGDVCPGATLCTVFRHESEINVGHSM